MKQKIILSFFIKENKNKINILIGGWHDREFLEFSELPVMLQNSN